MLRISVFLVILAWSAVPAWASAGMVPSYGKESLGDLDNRHCLEANFLIRHVAENVFDTLPGTRRESVESRWDTEDRRERSMEDPNYSDRSGKDTGLYDNFPIQSFDSVNGRSDGLSPWWGMPSAGEPMLKELSRSP